MSTKQIVHLNHLTDADFLSEGQVLRLTVTPVMSRQHNRKVAPPAAVARAQKKRPSHPDQLKMSRTDAQLAQHQALWIAMHTGFSTPDLAGDPSFGAAQRAIALELRLTKTAMRYLGVPYVWGGDSFSGVDCSGFVQAVFRRNGIQLPRTADAQFEIGRRISTSGLQPGDLVFFQTYAEGASHVGIYLGRGQFVHASSSNGVRIDSLSEAYYSSRFIGARRAAI